MCLARHLCENDGAVTGVCVCECASCMTFRYTYNYMSLDSYEEP